MRDVTEGVRETGMSEIPESLEAPAPPAWVKSIHWFLHLLRTNWEALVKPGVLLTVVVVGSTAYWFGTMKSAEVVEVKNERIQFLNDQIIAYKDRLQGATPDEAARRFS